MLHATLNAVLPLLSIVLRSIFKSVAFCIKIQYNFDIKRLEGYRNFCNKLWNASRFVKIQCQSIDNNAVVSRNSEDLWINSEFNKTLEDFSKYIESYRFDLATQSAYDFFWEKFCDWYIEFCKSTKKFVFSLLRRST